MKPETLQILKDERADMARQQLDLARRLELLDQLLGTRFVVTPALKAAVSTSKVQRRTSIERGGGATAGRRAAYAAATAKCSEVFSAEELAHHAGLPESKVRANLKYWAKQGIVTVVDRGNRGHTQQTYRRGLGWRKFMGGEKFHVEQSQGVTTEMGRKRKGRKTEDGGRKAEGAGPEAGAPEEKGPGLRLSRTAGPRGVSPQVVALEELFAGLSGAHSGPAIVEMVRTRWPELVAKDSQVSDLRVRLMDLFQAGKIRRMGIGPDARFAAMPAAGQVRVPRDTGGDA